MNKLVYIIFIIVIFLKTGNVFSNNNVFNVDNITVSKNLSKNKEILLNNAFKKGFKKLIKDILLKKDYERIVNTDFNTIKSLVFTFQITENETNNKNELIANIYFDREKKNKFFYDKNISYADITKSKIVLFPVLIKDDKIYLFSENEFYEKWNTESNDNQKETIEYILPVENLEDIQIINKYKNNLELVKTKIFLGNYDINDHIFLVTTLKKDKITIYLKGVISGNPIVKNFNLNDYKEEDHENTIKQIKLEISEIWKSQNLIDIRTPSFLNIILKVNKKDDLINLQSIFSSIDIIQNYTVLEFNKEFVKIKIKYLGKIDKIRKKLNNRGININIDNEEWEVKLK